MSEELQKIKANSAVTSYVWAPGDTTAAAAAWVPLRDFITFLAMYLRISGTDTVDTFEVQAATDSSGTDATTVLASTAQPDAVGDYASIEVSDECVKAIGVANSKEFTHVALVLQNGTDTDTAAVTYVRSDAKRRYKDLTSDSIA